MSPTAAIIGGGNDQTDGSDIGFGVGIGNAIGYVRAERRAEVDDALRCLVALTARRHRALHRALGLVAASPTPSGVESLLNLAMAEGGVALQVLFGFTWVGLGWFALGGVGFELFCFFLCVCLPAL